MWKPVNRVLRQNLNVSRTKSDCRQILLDNNDWAQTADWMTDKGNRFAGCRVAASYTQQKNGSSWTDRTERRNRTVRVFESGLLSLVANSDTWNIWIIYLKLELLLSANCTLPTRLNEFLENDFIVKNILNIITNIWT